MKNLNKFLILFIVLMTVVSISSISAADNSDDIVSSDYEDTVVSDRETPVSSISAADNSDDIVSSDYEDTVVSDGETPVNEAISPDDYPEQVEHSETNNDNLRATETITTITSGNSSKVGVKNTITATILTIDGAKVSGPVGQIQVRKNGNVVHARSDYIQNGLLKFDWTPTEEGSYEITMICYGNDQYGDSEDTQYFNALATPTTTNITSANETYARYDFQITANILGQNLEKVSGDALLTITMQSGSKVLEENVNVKDGLFTYTWNTNQSGKYDISIEYKGNGQYSPSNATQILNVEKIPTIVNITSSNNTSVGKSFKITAMITEKNGTKIDGKANIRIFTDKEIIIEKEGIGFKNSLFQFSWTPKEIGAYYILVAFQGGQGYGGNNDMQMFQVTKDPKPNLIVKNVKMYYIDGKKLLAKVLSSDGKPVVNLPVNFKISGKNFKVKTNSKGIAGIPIKFKPNTYKVVTTIPGTQIKKVSSLKVNKWKKSLTSLKAKNLVKKYNTPARLYVNLKHNKVPAAGQIITIKVSKYTYKIKTNEKGIASLGIHFKPGVWNVKVSINIAGVSKTKDVVVVVKK